MTTIKREDILVARVLNEDKDYIIVEIGKRDDVEFHLDGAADNNRFFTVMFAHVVDGNLVVWKPWEAEST